MNRFVALTMMHAAAAIGLSLAFQSHHSNDFLAVVFLGRLFGQVALLAIWGGLGPASGPRRVIGLCTAAVGLWVVVLTGTDVWSDTSAEDRVGFAMLIAACLTPTVGAFLALKRWGPRLRISRASNSSTTSKPFQFSMKHLFMLAFTVSAVLTLGRFVREIEEDYLSLWFRVAIISAVLVVCLLHLVLAAVWACLAADKVALRMLAALVAALLFGLLPAYSFGQDNLSEYMYCAMCAGIGQMVTFVSLAVVRSAGYRVEATKPAVDPTTADFRALGSHPLD